MTNEQKQVHRLIDESQRSSGKDYQIEDVTPKGYGPEPAPALKPEIIKIADANGFEIFTTGRFIPAY